MKKIRCKYPAKSSEMAKIKYHFDFKRNIGREEQNRQARFQEGDVRIPIYFGSMSSKPGRTKDLAFGNVFSIACLKLSRKEIRPITSLSPVSR